MTYTQLSSKDSSALHENVLYLPKMKIIRQTLLGKIISEHLDAFLVLQKTFDIFGPFSSGRGSHIGFCLEIFTTKCFNNDPLGQTQSPASNDHYKILKVMETDGLVYKHHVRK